MTEQEKINADVQMKLAMQDAKFNIFMQEMLDRDNQRVADIREIRAELASLGRHIRNMSIATIIGVSTIAITVVYSILTR